MPIIEALGLHKRYRGVVRGSPLPALAGLDLVVEGPGVVHGFLGPNGSGKTTTLRALLGLVSLDAGEARLFGEPVPRGLPSVIGRVGALVEAPQLFPAFSGRRNLELLAAVAGLPDRRVEEVLDRVGMTARASERVSAYSLGMRQRIGIAAALLKSPDLLLLDEPTNGLDPAGIREVRDLLRDLAAGGTTVLLSSHLLAEVQQVCDEVTIVSRGRTVATGPVGEITGEAAGRRLRVGIAPSDVGTARGLLTSAGLTVSEPAVERESPTGTGLVHLEVSGTADPAQVTRVLAEAGVYLSELTTSSPDLEAAFLALTGEPTR